jgi:hypothetical protein
MNVSAVIFSLYYGRVFLLLDVMIILLLEVMMVQDVYSVGYLMT